MATGERKIIAVADADAVARTAAERLQSLIGTNSGRIAICLTGGSGPLKLYELLATADCHGKIPWARVHWFIGDERFVPAADPLNNMAAARRIFLDACAPAQNVHPIPTDGANPDEGAARYEHTLKSFHGATSLDPVRPLFDLVLMGIGPDGHTASLFPGAAALTESERWVVGVPKAPVEPFVPRITLTLRALASCREMLFQIAGSGKRAILTRLLANENLPANRASSTGETIWLADRAALPEDFRG
ncbi:MAG: 6-phosphogluconolactonase [Bradyrhizobium sp.]|nr:6-phosphogluconolactonase [Bradyrhizobium sp.]